MSEKIDFTMSLCSSKASYSCKLHPSMLKHAKRKMLDLENIKQHCHVKSDAGIALVLFVEPFEIIVHGYGELLFKTTDPGQISLIKKIADKIYKAGLDF